MFKHSSRILTLVLILATIFGVLATTNKTPVRAAGAPLNLIKANSNVLYDSVTGANFVPRGANYMRIGGTAASPYVNTFEPGRYTSAEAQNILDGLKIASSYNAVRVFIDPGDGNFAHGIGTNTTSDGLNTAYLNNVADFVNRAAANGIYVMMSMDAWPGSTPYLNAYVAAGGNQDVVDGNNAWFMSKGRIAAKKLYLKNFVADLVSRVGANKTAVLAYETDNEAYFDTAYPPFNRTTGTFLGTDGLTYDMASPSSRQQAADASLVIYSQSAADGVHASDSTALVSMGFFTNYAVGRTSFNGLPASANTWAPGRPAAVSIYGGADFIDLHTYPDNVTTYSASNDLATSEVGLVAKPYIIGEFGAQKSVYSNNIVTAAYAMRDLQIAECSVLNSKSKGAQGWLFWTYDTDTTTSLANQGLFYSLADSNGAINGQLAPVVRPDPCRL